MLACMSYELGSALCAIIPVEDERRHHGERHVIGGAVA